MKNSCTWRASTSWRGELSHSIDYLPSFCRSVGVRAQGLAVEAVRAVRRHLLRGHPERPAGHPDAAPGAVLPAGGAARHRQEGAGRRVVRLGVRAQGRQ